MVDVWIMSTWVDRSMYVLQSLLMPQLCQKYCQLTKQSSNDSLSLTNKWQVFQIYNNVEWSDYRQIYNQFGIISKVCMYKDAELRQMDKHLKSRTKFNIFLRTLKNKTIFY